MPIPALHAAQYERMTRVMMPDKMANNLRSFIAGQRQTGTKEKQDLGLTLLESKRPISAEAYELVCKHFFTVESWSMYLHICLMCLTGTL